MPRKIRVLVGKPGLDGHDRGAKVVAAALRDAGMEVIYTGLHQTPEQIVEAALQEDVDVVALSILSGAHMTLFPEVLELMKDRGIDDKLLTGGGIIPAEDMQNLAQRGVGKLFGPGASTQDIAEYIRGWFVALHGVGALEPAEMPRPPEPSMTALARVQSTPEPARPAARAASGDSRRTAATGRSRRGKATAERGGRTGAAAAPTKTARRSESRPGSTKKKARTRARRAAGGSGARAGKSARKAAGARRGR